MKNLLVLILAFATQAFCQTARIYIVPIVQTDTVIVRGIDTLRLSFRNPKYFANLTNKRQCIDFGLENFMIVRASVTQAQHDSISSFLDVDYFPSNLDENLTVTSANIISLKLEAKNIPSDWINTTFTYRQVLKRIIAIAQFLQRFNGIIGNTRLFSTGITLETRFNQLPVRVRNALVNTANDMGFDASSLTATSTLRTILKEMFAQWLARRGDIIIGDERF